MAEDELVLDKMITCTISNGYDGIEEFGLLAQDKPEAALLVAWKVLTNREDPGRDSGSLCVELLETVTDAVGQVAVEKLILDEWPRLSDSIRRNITAGSGSTKAMSTGLGLRLFEHPATRVEQRHHIVAGLAARDRSQKYGALIVDLAGRIGSYPESHRQEILERFIADIARNYN